MIYIDFDGVLVDTWPEIMALYLKEYKSKKIEEEKLRALFKKLDWESIIASSYKNEHNLKLLQEFLGCDIKIITKINSEAEKDEKLKFLDKFNLHIPIIFVDIDQSKSDVVNPKGSILIDDEIKNLNEWMEKGGICILYSKNKDNCDSDGIANHKFPVIFDLSKDLFLYYYEYVDKLQNK